MVKDNFERQWKCFLDFMLSAGCSELVSHVRLELAIITSLFFTVGATGISIQCHLNNIQSGEKL